MAPASPSQVVESRVTTALGHQGRVVRPARARDRVTDAAVVVNAVRNPPTITPTSVRVMAVPAVDATKPRRYRAGAAGMASARGKGRQPRSLRPATARLTRDNGHFAVVDHAVVGRPARADLSEADYDAVHGIDGGEPIAAATFQGRPQDGHARSRPDHWRSQRRRRPGGGSAPRRRRAGRSASRCGSMRPSRRCSTGAGAGCRPPFVRRV